MGNRDIDYVPVRADVALTERAASIAWATDSFVGDSSATPSRYPMDTPSVLARIANVLPCGSDRTPFSIKLKWVRWNRQMPLISLAERPDNVRR